VSGFADDLAVWVKGELEESKRKMQWAVDRVWSWSKECMMVVAVEKCSVLRMVQEIQDGFEEVIIRRCCWH